MQTVKTTRFRLTGIPPEYAMKTIDVDHTKTVQEIKKSVQSAYDLNPILGIQFIFRGKVISDTLRFKDIRVKENEVVTIMATQAGGY